MKALETLLVHTDHQTEEHRPRFMVAIVTN